LRHAVLWKDCSLERRTDKFRAFYRTMSFVDAMARIANVEDHHPELMLRKAQP